MINMKYKIIENNSPDRDPDVSAESHVIVDSLEEVRKHLESIAKDKRVRTFHIFESKDGIEPYHGNRMFRLNQDTFF